MSIDSEVTSMTQNIQADYEGLENIGADLTGIDKNIQNIRPVLDTIYNDLPKVTGEGTEVTLTPTRKGRLALIPKGNSIQEGEPTPSTPFPIKSVTGDNNVVVRGKNLLKLTDIAETTTTDNVKYKVENNKLYINGTVQTAFTPFSENLATEIPNGTYTMSAQLLSGTISGTTNCSLKVRPQTSGGDTYTATFGAVFVPTTFTDKVARAFCNINSGITFNNAVIGFQIKLGNQDTTFEPYYTPQTKPFTLAEGQRLMVDDYLADDGIHHVRKQDNLKSSKDWVLSVISNDYSVFSIAINDLKPGSVLLCSDFIEYPYTEVRTATKEGIGVHFSDPTLYVCIRKSLIGSEGGKNAFNNYLNQRNLENNPIIVEYEMLEETIEPYNSTQQAQWNEIKKMQSYSGTTIITSTYEEGNAQMIINASALKGE